MEWNDGRWDDGYSIGSVKIQRPYFGLRSSFSRPLCGHAIHKPQPTGSSLPTMLKSQHPPPITGSNGSNTKKSSSSTMAKSCKRCSKQTLPGHHVCAECHPIQTRHKCIQNRCNNAVREYIETDAQRTNCPKHEHLGCRENSCNGQVVFPQGSHGKLRGYCQYHMCDGCKDPTKKVYGSRICIEGLVLQELPA